MGGVNFMIPLGQLSSFSRAFKCSFTFSSTLNDPDTEITDLFCGHLLSLASVTWPKVADALNVPGDVA